MVSPLQIYRLTHADQDKQAPDLNLDPSRYVVHPTALIGDALDWLQSRPDPPDCLVVDEQVWQDALRPALQELNLVLPVVVLVSNREAIARPVPQSDQYSGTVVHHSLEALSQVDRAIQTAIQEFLRHSNASQADSTTASAHESSSLVANLSNQQHQLTEKLKARLGYLGVYYKRNPSQFFRHLNREDRQALLDQLKSDYRKIVLAYFASNVKLNLNQLIDDFVDQAFMSDISVAQIVEIHMELMDTFSKQLKLEGRSEEILLDYRLTLIDVIAHLCEMYRRSIPREP
ncbi:circadian clock protein KaiA [Nodosilinea sp. AN01ver1]|uniref:circadian clock protein KaiA n=1 Tax=Nodosilinea sp. AN01ver1 TaxID=3423362 RepID=UPI003D31EE01